MLLYHKLGFWDYKSYYVKDCQHGKTYIGNLLVPLQNKPVFSLKRRKKISSGILESKAMKIFGVF